MITLIYNITSGGKMDTIHGDNIFVQSFSYPSHQKRTPLPDFREFVADKILENVVNETNITSFKKVANP